MLETQLPQNLTPWMDSKTKQKFVRYIEKHNVNTKNDQQLQMAYGKFSALENGGNEFARSSGLVGTPTTDYSLYNEGPFSWMDEEVLSDLVGPGSQLAQWIPTSTITNNARYETVTHFEWDAPVGWETGSYATYLSTLENPECGYADGEVKWNGFQYQIPLGRFSKATKAYERGNDLAIYLDYERSPRFRMRGPLAGLKLTNDVDFGMSLTLMHIQKHFNYVLSFGEAANSSHEWDGLDTILQTGYVSARLIPGSTGTPDGFSDPKIIDASSFADIATLVNALRRGILYIRNRASKRGYTIMDNDMAIRMPLELWQLIAEYLAVNGVLSGVTQSENPAAADARFQQIMSDQAFMVNGRRVPVMVDDDLAALNDDRTVMTTDIQILVRRAGGMNILEQQYVDYSKIYLPAGLESESVMSGFGGILRWGWIEENKKCFYWFGEMQGRLVSSYQPFQMVFTNFSLNVEEAFPVEAASYTSEYYAFFNGTTIGAGSI